MENHQTDIDFLDINVTNLEREKFAGTITGDVSVTFEVNQALLDTYTFDTAYDATIVDDGVSGGLLGVVEGTVDPTDGVWKT